MKPVIHIGPPKTATTSLQDGVIPHLGRPFQIKPLWARDLARSAAFERPQIPGDVIVSHESLGDFRAFTPEVIVQRLAQIFDEAVVVVVFRDPLELFYSLYRQRLINGVGVAARTLAAKGTLLWPIDVNAFFDTNLKRYRDHGLGFFAMTSFKTNRAVFGRKFDVQIIQFDLVRSNPDAFVSAFVDICGGGPQPPLVHSNKTDAARMDEALATSRLKPSTSLSGRFLDYYNSSVLSEDRADFIRNWSTPQRIEASTNAVSFRDP